MYVFLFYRYILSKLYQSGTCMCFYFIDIFSLNSVRVVHVCVFIL